MFNIGDIVARKSYGGDIPFMIIDIINRGANKPIYVLKGIMYRIIADSGVQDDLVKLDPVKVQIELNQNVIHAKRYASNTAAPVKLPFFVRFRTRPGRILHIDSASDFLDRCLQFYKEAGLRSIGIHASESEQPRIIRGALEKHRPDIVVITGHDGLKKGADKFDLENGYRNSKYFVKSVKEARSYQPDMSKLSVYAGACQSYFEAIMDAGSNFASSPGRILINALDPAIVSKKIATTDSGKMVTPREVAHITISGADGIGGINTKGHLISL